MSLPRGIKQALRKLPLLPGIFRGTRSWLIYWKQYARVAIDFRRFKSMPEGRAVGFSMRWEERYPCLGDQTDHTFFDRHYVYHLAWASRVLAQLKPALHTDISSSLHFVTMLSAFMPMKFYDFRPAELALDNLTSDAADLTQLPFADQSMASLSCMHVLEHIGLGRYGDPLDPEGYWKAMLELKRVTAPGGTLLIVVPVGRPRILFNAHRIFSYEQVLACFEGLTLKQFALIPDEASQGGLVIDADPGLVGKQEYGCGCFWFTRGAA